VSASGTETNNAFSVGYTNSSGTSGQTATNSDAIVTAGVKTGDFYRVGLQAGDVGVQSVQSITLSNATWTGTVNLVAYRVIASVEIHRTDRPLVFDAVDLGFPQLFNGSVPFLIFVPQSNSFTLQGRLTYAWG
jgi:hypothetical protein